MSEASGTKYHRLMGRLFVVVAEFDDTDEGTTQANAYMTAHPGIGVLEVVGGKVILASNTDKGIQASGEAVADEAEIKPQKMFNHAFTFGFEVGGSRNEDGSDVTQEQMFDAIVARAKDLLSKNQLVHAVGSAFDTYEVQD